MKNGIYLTIDDDGKAREVKYDNRYDITIHCESQESHDRVLELLEKARSMKWIPVSESLPNENVPVNVTWTNNNPEPYYESIKGKRYTATGIYFRGDWYWYSSICEEMLGEYGRWDADRIDDDIEIVAWMPLPQEYTEEMT